MDTMVMKLTENGLCLYHRQDGSWYESDGKHIYGNEPAPQKHTQIKDPVKVNIASMM